MRQTFARTCGVSAARHLIVAGLVALMVAVGSCRSRQGDSRELKLGYVMAPVGAAHEGAEKFAELVKAKTGGKLTVKLYHSAALGTDRQLAEGLTFGSVDLVLSGLASISPDVPQYEVLEAPYVFRDYDHLARVVNGEIGKEVADALLKAKRIRILDWWARGPRYLTTNKEIKTPTDLKGLKLRVPELPTYIEAWRILGANPTPITYSDMFMALKRGTVEGQENPLEVIYSASLYEVQKYVIETRHLLGTYLLMVGEDLFSGLPPDQQAALKTAAVEAGRYGHELMLKYEQDYTAKLKAKGMTFVTVDTDAFRGPVVTRLPAAFEDKWAPGLFDRIQKTK